MALSDGDLCTGMSTLEARRFERLQQQQQQQPVGTATVGSSRGEGSVRGDALATDDELEALLAQSALAMGAQPPTNAGADESPDRLAGIEGSALGAGDDAEEGREAAGEGEAEAALLAAAAMRARLAAMMGDLDAG